ncbi:hypothetical protein M9H77_10488 [Catharanthus roseus]|uniref:Uncharacterized protein n=1 Tax=Catharanthus roseus TaxID=4058 RepID=A0ACC0BBW2_CATRO|nr:hypothetical protein M9H77_10488 [Catharanthus roseus]
MLGPIFRDSQVRSRQHETALLLEEKVIDRGMESHNNIVLIIMVVMSSSRFAKTEGRVDCSTVTAFISACTTFIAHGFPDPYPESPCCVAISSLNNFSDSPENRRDICRCLMDMIANHSSNATAIATLPGFCGVSLGFGIDANTDCE